MASGHIWAKLAKQCSLKVLAKGPIPELGPIPFEPAS